MVTVVMGRCLERWIVAAKGELGRPKVKALGYRPFGMLMVFAGLKGSDRDENSRNLPPAKSPQSPPY